MVFLESKYPACCVALMIPLLWAAVPSYVSAQTPDSTVTCAPATAEAFLEVGNVRAKILNNGGLFWNGGAPIYEVPKGGGVHAISTAGLWIGGMIDDELRVAASSYGPWEFWPGPVVESDQSAESCAGADRIWEAKYDDLRTDGSFSDDRVLDWPAALGAPFMDVDRDGDYAPEHGDRPEMLGDQQLWWIMNDAGGEHRASKSAPIGVEVRATAFAFESPGAVGNSTFIRYRIRNTAPFPLTEAFASIWSDTDLGAAYDDYIGSDSTLGLAYSYNADNDDDNHYGTAPPAIGFTVLKRPVSSFHEPEACSYPDTNEVGFTNVISYYNGTPAYSGPPTERISTTSCVAGTSMARP